MRQLKDILLDLVVELERRAEARHGHRQLTGEVLPPPRPLRPLDYVEPRGFDAPTGEPVSYVVPGSDEYVGRPRFAIVRYRDGKAWAGPWRNEGKLFTSVPGKWHMFEDYGKAVDAADNEKFKFRVDVLEF